MEIEDGGIVAPGTHPSRDAAVAPLPGDKGRAAWKPEYISLGPIGHLARYTGEMACVLTSELKIISKWGQEVDILGGSQRQVKKELRGIFDRNLEELATQRRHLQWRGGLDADLTRRALAKLGPAQRRVAARAVDLSEASWLLWNLPWA